MSGLSLAGLSAPLTALSAAASRFPHLPAPTVSISTIFPEALALTFHDDDYSAAGFAAFEAWREALDIDPLTVVHRVQADGQTGVLGAHGAFAGAAVELVAYATVPAPESAPTARMSIPACRTH
ncbi:hypothetical protein SLA_3794 [Streptomyces laurentii]|uniref:Uncharacterized protein n=1 Tax=Streptomyces laurentii TaxID=39478 RepID=A0A169NNC5_STRLU|nr:hypothetical protein SLA_3794 [Streptomyces laurentii]